jgi:FkbM family methyltransferase
MRSLLKRLAAKTPETWQQELKRHHFRRLIRKGVFSTEEPEYKRLNDWLSLGDWAIDIGANIGHYTLEISRLVGTDGRVLAIEPVPTSFDLLASNVAFVGLTNVTLLNLAASDRQTLAGMEIPMLDTGLRNPYMAHLTEDPATLKVMCVQIDQLPLPKRVTLVKIDAEGHELQVLTGMTSLLERDRPVLIVEDSSEDVITFLKDLGYTTTKLKGSPNRLFTHP